MNKNDLIVAVSQKLGKSKKDVSEIVEEFLNQIADGLFFGERITLTNFGTFEKKELRNINIYSPYDGSLIQNTFQTRIHFKSSSNLKTKLASKKSTD